MQENAPKQKTKAELEAEIAKNQEGIEAAQMEFNGEEEGKLEKQNAELKKQLESLSENLPSAEINSAETTQVENMGGAPEKVEGLTNDVNEKIAGKDEEIKNVEQVTEEKVEEVKAVSENIVNDEQSPVKLNFSRELTEDEKLNKQKKELFNRRRTILETISNYDGALKSNEKYLEKVSATNDQIKKGTLNINNFSSNEFALSYGTGKDQFEKFVDSMKNVERRTAEKVTELKEHLKTLENRKQQAIEDIKEAGLDPESVPENTWL